jgi:hypothetical protein
MDTVFVLKSIWVFLLGVAVSLIGLYTLLTRPDMGSNPFIIMLMGLFFTGAGSIYGKKKLRGGYPPGSVPPEREQRGLGYPPFFQLPRRREQYPGEAPPEPREYYTEAREEHVEPTAPSEPREVPMEAIEPREPREPAETPSEDFLEIAEEKIGTETVAPSKTPVGIATKPKGGRILKIVVCPNCGAENETKDKFCYSCGFKIKPDKKKKRKKPVAKKTAPKKPAVKITTKKPISKTPKTESKFVLKTTHLTTKTPVKLPAKKKPVKKAKKKPAEKSTDFLEAAESV